MALITPTHTGAELPSTVFADHKTDFTTVESGIAALDVRATTVESGIAALDVRATTVESGIAALDAAAMQGINQIVALYPAAGVVPSGWVDTGNTMLGMRMLISDASSGAVYVNGMIGFTALPNSSLYKDSGKVGVASISGDLIKLVDDTSPNNSLILAPSDLSRPTLRGVGSIPYFEFDGVDDRLTIQNSMINTAASSFVCSVRVRAAGSFPHVFANEDTNAGLFVGFETGGTILRFAVSGGSFVTPLVAYGGSVTLNTRVTISCIFDGVTLKGFLNGLLVVDVPAVGVFSTGIQQNICQSISPLNSPIDLFGAIYVGTAITDSERIKLESIVETGGYLTGDTSAVNTAMADLATSISVTVADQAAAIAVQQVGIYYGLVDPTITTIYAIGDSTVASYLGGTAIMTLMSSVRIKHDISVPGNTIAQQKTAWLALTPVPNLTGYVIVQIGLNDLQPAGPATITIARLQDLIDTIRADVGQSVPIIISKMIPCHQRLLNLYGAIDGETSYQKWIAMNDAIAGIGATPIAGVQGRITAHVPLMGDAVDNLLAVYDTGDAIHPNTAGRTVNAAAWNDMLTALGITA